MTTVYQWTIQALDCKPEEDGKTNVVVTAHWSVSATDGTNSAGVYGTQTFTLTGESAFTPFEDLTQDQVVGWVQESMGIDAVTALQENLDSQIENKINPPIVTKSAPWITETPVV